jgi:hypothetical protein
MNQQIQEQYAANRALHTRRRLLLLVSGFLAYGLAQLLSTVPAVTEVVYGSWVGPNVARVLSLITGLVPIALCEIFVALVIARQLWGASIALIDVKRGKRQFMNASRAGGLRLAQDLGVLIAAFYLLWGFNYSRAPLQERMEWPSLGYVTSEELSHLTEQMILEANESYVDIHGSEDASQPTRLPQQGRSLPNVLAAGWVKARQELGLPTVSGPFGRPKTPLFTPWYEWIGVAGFYFPYTGEANLRGGIPAVDRPKMLAHEMAHQRGVARESEANFWGYLAASHSGDPYARYSAFVFAQRQLLSILAPHDRDLAASLARRRHPGVQRDIEDSREYWATFRGHGTELGNTVNHAFLRTNRVEGGIRNYSMSTILLIAYARSQGGRLAPQWDDSFTPTAGGGAR